MLNIPAERHIAVREYAYHFDGAHLSHPSLRVIVFEFEDLAQSMIDSLSDSPELSHMLRRLVEAKDCAVRAKVAELRKAVGGTPPNRPDLRRSS